VHIGKIAGEKGANSMTGLHITCDSINASRAVITDEKGNAIDYITGLSVNFEINEMVKANISMCPQSIKMKLEDVDCNLKNLDEINALLVPMGYRVVQLTHENYKSLTNKDA
jgi:hypothetical protein